MDSDEADDIPEEKVSESPIYGPLTLSEDTKTFLDCEKLTPENPMMLLPRETLTEDVKEKLEESDFFAYKDDIEAYPDDEDILLVLDVDVKYGRDYYICLTVDAKEAVISEKNQIVETKEEVKTEEEIEVKSLETCTEDEVNMERDGETRPRIKIFIIPNEEVERRPLKLSSSHPADDKRLFTEILPESEYYEDPLADVEKTEPIYRKVMDAGIQVAVAFTEGFSQTARCKIANDCAQTELKLFTEEEMESIWKSSEMASFLPAMEKRLSDVLLEIGGGGLEKPWAFEELRESEISTGMVPLTVNKSFICVGEGESKMITSIDWHPQCNDVLVVSTAHNCTYEDHVDNLSNLLLEPCFLYVWSFEDQLLPRLLLDACDEIATVKFNPTMPIIAGGSASGLLVLWDLTEYRSELKSSVNYDWTRHATPYNVASLGDDTELQKSPVVRYIAACNIDHCHLLGLNRLEWIPAGVEVQVKGELNIVECDQSFQLVSCGSDGFLRFWDIRLQVEKYNVHAESLVHVDSPYEALDMIWKPFHLVEVKAPDGQKHASLTTFSLKVSQRKNKAVDNATEEASDMWTVFFAGTDDGNVLQSDFNMCKGEDEKPATEPPKPRYYTSVHGVPMHSGAIVEIAHSPFFEDIFFSLGDKTMVIWKEDQLQGPLFLDICKTSNITAGHWSPTRPAVFTLGLQDGSLRVWDLLQSSHAPQLLQVVASAPITTINTRWMSNDEQVLVIGDGSGFVHILDLPMYLWRPVENERQIVEQLLEREVKRVKWQAQKQAEIDAKKAAELKRLEEEKKTKKEKTAQPPHIEVKPELSKEEVEQAALKHEYEHYLKTEEQYLIELGYLIPIDEKEVVEENDN